MHTLIGGTTELKHMENIYLKSVTSWKGSKRSSYWGLLGNRIRNKVIIGEERKDSKVEG
jgi:hypothetical protein